MNHSHTHKIIVRKEVRDKPYSLARVTGPTVEPISLVEAKDHLEIIASDTTHDAKIARFISAAREQLEDDTNYVLNTQTFTLSMTRFPIVHPITFPVMPVVSVQSVKYRDLDNVEQTLSTDVYKFSSARRSISLKYDQDWPAYTPEEDGIIIAFTAGFGATAASVPALCRQAILLQLAKWFVHRGDEGQVHGRGTYDAAYEALVQRLMRTSYP